MCDTNKHQFEMGGSIPHADSLTSVVSSALTHQVRAAPSSFPVRHDDPQQTIDDSFLAEKNTPVPRKYPPNPQESPRRSLESITSAPTDDVGTTLFENPKASTGLYHVAGATPRTEFAAVDIIRAQQLQIEYLQRQVEDLKTVIAELQIQATSSLALSRPEHKTSNETSVTELPADFDRRNDHDDRYAEPEQHSLMTSASNNPEDDMHLEYDTTINEDDDSYDEDFENYGDHLEGDDHSAEGKLNIYETGMPSEYAQMDQFYMEPPSMPVLDLLMKKTPPLTINPLDSFVPNIPYSHKKNTSSSRSISPVGLNGHYFESEVMAINNYHSSMFTYLL